MALVLVVIEQQLVLTLQPSYDAKLGNLADNYLPPAAAMHKLAQGQGITITYYPSGPLLEYDLKSLGPADRRRPGAAQTRGGLNAGVTGGALLNLDGEMIGLTNAVTVPR